VDSYYVKDGEPTSEPSLVRLSLKVLKRLYGHSPATEFGPLALKAVRQSFVEAGLCRNEVNRRTRHIVRGSSGVPGRWVQRTGAGPTIEPEEATRSFPQDTGASAMLVNILGIIDDAKGYEMVRQLRWPDGVRCARCDSGKVVKQGRDETEPQRQRYACRSCDRRFDDLTDTIFAGHHQPLRVWVLVL
jgi:hypothetical protein